MSYGDVRGSVRTLIVCPFPAICPLKSFFAKHFSVKIGDIDKLVRVYTIPFLKLASLSIHYIPSRGFTLMGFDAAQNCVSGLLPLFGAIFISNTKTKEECLTSELFGLPASFSRFVKQVRAGMILFLYDYETRLLHGVFQACSNGALNIVPDAYRSFGKQYPAQVKMTPIWHCSPLSEDEFRDAIKENYFSEYKFRFGLDEEQVHHLLSLFSVRKLNGRLLLTDSTRNNSASANKSSGGSRLRYIGDNGYMLKKRIIDKQDIDDDEDQLQEISKDSLSFMERDKVLEEHPRLTPSEHSPLKRFRRNYDGMIDKLSSEYAEGRDFIPLIPSELRHYVPSDFHTSFCYNKSFQVSDQFRPNSIVHHDIESHDFIPLNLSYSGDEMETRSPIYDPTAHETIYSPTGAGNDLNSMQKYNYPESIIPSLGNPSVSVGVKLLDRWRSNNYGSSNSLYGAEYLEHLDRGFPKILNDRGLAFSEIGNNRMENRAQFVSPSKYSYSEFGSCSPLLAHDRYEHKRVQLENSRSFDCDLEYHQSSKSELPKDPNRKSVFCRLTPKKSVQHIDHEEHDNDASVDDIMAVLHSSSSVWRKSRAQKLPKQNFDDDENLEKSRKDFPHELEAMKAFLTAKESDDQYHTAEGTVFLDFKRRSQSGKTSDNLNLNNLIKSVEAEDLHGSGKGKKRKLIRRSFGESEPLDSNSNSKLQSSEVCISKVNAGSSNEAWSASNDKKDKACGNVELLQASCEGDLNGQNRHSPKVSKFEELLNTSVQISCEDSSQISTGGLATEDITPTRPDSKS